MNSQAVVPKHHPILDHEYESGLLIERQKPLYINTAGHEIAQVKLLASETIKYYMQPLYNTYQFSLFL